MQIKKIAIVGGVGLPANYSGYETLTENIAQELSKDFDLFVYCSSKAYTHRLKSYNGANLVYIPFKANGYQSILYDLLSILDAIFKHKIHSILILGIGIGIFIPFLRLISPKTNFIVHFDGLEWKRNKWNRLVKFYLKLNEKIAGKYAHRIIADNLGIQDYVKQTYNRESAFIQYGAQIEQNIPEKNPINSLVFDDNYDLSICRIVPENNIELILKAYSKSSQNLVFVGNWEESGFGRKLKNKYKMFSNILLLEKIFEQDKLNFLKQNAKRYIHGHSVGGTNPSLIEAMYFALPILAFDINFNRHTCFDKGYFFDSTASLLKLHDIPKEELIAQGKLLKEQAIKTYNWSKVAQKYKEVFDAF